MSIVISDVDDVVADFVPQWIGIYNSEWGDSLKVSQITGWDISKFIKDQRNKEHLYRYLEDPKLYDNVLPIKNALWGINKLRKMGHRIIYVTSTPLGQQGRKYIWLKDHGFITNKNDYVETTDKSVIRGHWMLDDRIDNVRSFIGRGILFEREWNKKENWNIKCKNWKEIVKLIQSTGEFGLQ